MLSSLVSLQNRVESPFIILQIGEYTFGHCLRTVNRNLLKVTYPNYLTSIDIKKINGAVNIYTINMSYGITANDDPNLLEKVFSSVSDNRLITLHYGDWSVPNYIYKNEEAIISSIKSKVDFTSARIDYTIHATSTTLSLTAGTYNFPYYRSKKPSEEIKRILLDESFGLLEIYYGMKNCTKPELSKFIESDDQEVEIQAQNGVTILAYINYLVSCMTSLGDTKSDTLKQSNYYWASYDDINNEYGGPYFKVIKITSNAKYNPSYNCYEVDIGYPSGNLVSNFTIDNNESWSLLYNYAQKVQTNNYIYEIDNDGKMQDILSPTITNSSKFLYTTEASKSWWSKMTQYPISAKLTIKGLLRPAMLMSYVKINTYFYGHKHISSGLYIVNKQEDRIDSSGYKTTIGITRISGEDLI